MTTKEILVAARKLIEKPENWTQGRFSDGNGAFCASGALTHVGGSNLSGAPEYVALRIAMYPSGTEYDLVCNFNDSHSHVEVLEAFDKAIAAQE